MRESAPQLSSTTKFGTSAEARSHHPARERSSPTIGRGLSGRRCLPRDATGYQRTPRADYRKFGADSMGVGDLSLRSLFLINLTLILVNILIFLGFLMPIKPDSKDADFGTFSAILRHRPPVLAHFTDALIIFDPPTDDRRRSS